MLIAFAAIAALVAGACGSSPSGQGYTGTGADGGGSNGGGGSGGGLGGGSSGGLGGVNDDSGSASSSGGGSGGPTTCDPSCAAAGGTCNSGTCVISENPGGVSSGNQGSLGAGGTADSAFAWLYPYDKTVFPRGLLPLILQFGGTAFDSAYVHVSFPGMDYKGYFGAPASPLLANQIQFSAAVWTAITNAAQATSAVQVDVTKMTGTAVTGPITETWTIAQGNIRGTIYYETYGSQILGGAESVGIMKIQPGATTPTPVKSGCGNVCHTASADGSTLVANVTLGFSSASYNLKASAATIYSAPNMDLTYGGIYPDGSFVMSATNYRTWTIGPSRLYSTATGANIPAAGWDSVITNGGTPAFSPDGTMIAFNHEDTGGGHTLAAASFDKTTNTFSGMADIASDSANTLAWPAFTPDTKNVLFHAGSDAAFETDNGATGDLYVVDIATHTKTRLDAADGYTATGNYLPANDPGLSFAPTVLPEAVGGYFWAVFTSHRSYGNTEPSQDNGDQNGKLWVTAIDINATAGTDSSHPAFFLDGQELTADNLRGFWVLNPCQANGRACTSGDECCGGFCRGGEDGGLVCLSAPTAEDGGSTCSQDFEKCSTAADCCNVQDECINSLCAEPAPK